MRILIFKKGIYYKMREFFILYYYYIITFAYKFQETNYNVYLLTK